MVLSSGLGPTDWQQQSFLLAPGYPYWCLKPRNKLVVELARVR
jgi:hypothetical protein